MENTTIAPTTPAPQQDALTSAVIDTLGAGTPVELGVETLIEVSNEVEFAMHEAFDVQFEYENETKFQADFVAEAIKRHVVYTSRQMVNTWQRTVDKATRTYPTKTRDQVIEHICSQASNRKLRDAALEAEKLQKKYAAQQA